CGPHPKSLPQGEKELVSNLKSAIQKSKFRSTPFCFSFLLESLQERKIQHLLWFETQAGKISVVLDHVLDGLDRNQRKPGSHFHVNAACLLQFLDCVRFIVFAEEANDPVLVSLVA